MPTTIDIPADPAQPDKRWRPRDYQKPFWRDFERGIKRAICIWHRRLGKDECYLHALNVAAHQRIGTYWYMLPEANQVRKAIWESIDEERQIRRLDIAFPKILRARVRDNDMFMALKCGSTIQFIGSDNYDSAVGSPPVGVVFSEWPLANPAAWGYISPILEKNGGWAFFNGTPRGPNHGMRMYDMAKEDPEKWHASLYRADETDIFSELQLASIKKEYIKLYGEVVGLSMYNQEYMCSFEAAILGAVYGREMGEARSEGRICSVPYDPAYPVETWWDLGYRNSMAIWFIQRMPGRALHAIDYYENNLAGLDHYAQVLQEKGYVYSRHLVPHDAAHGEIGSGKTLIAQGADLGLRMEKIPQSPLIPQINATRPVIKRMRFDSEKCRHGLDCLTNYRYGFDEKKHTFTPTPLHDWTSDGADALRTGAMAKDISSRNGKHIKRRMSRI